MEKILDNNYYDVIINNLMVPNFGSGDDITLLNSNFSLLHISRRNMDLCDLGINPYHLFPALYTLTSIIGPDCSQPFHTQQTPEFLLSGQGIMIGVVDTGIDYLHPAFLNRDGTTKIQAIWDQTNQAGPQPAGFTFGTEFTKASINSAINSTNPYTVVSTEDSNGHGTAIASIIAGSEDNNSSFRGIVPNAELAIVKLKESKDNLKMIFSIPNDKLCYQESDIVLGIRYLVTLARRLKRSIVICLALGSSQGSHDGHGILGRYIDDLVQMPDIGIVTSAGNEGNRARHYFSTVALPPYSHNFQLTVGPEDRKFSMEIWPDIPGRLSIEVTSPNMEKIPSVDPSLDDCTKYLFQTSESILWVNNMTFERGSGNQLILLRFENPMPGIWNFLLTSTEEEHFSFNSWLPSGNLISNDTYFPDPDPEITITAPGNTRNILTVTAYNQDTGDILYESGRGFTRSGIIKPDLAAPGYNITCAIPGGHYGTLTGTGAAAAQASGSMAILFEWTEGKGNFTNMTGEQANRMLIRNTRRDPTSHYPNRIWGYGILDVYSLLRRFSMLL